MLFPSQKTKNNNGRYTLFLTNLNIKIFQTH